MKRQQQMTLKWRQSVRLSPSAITFITGVAILVLNMLTGMITARLLGASGRGEHTIMLLWPMLLGYTVTFGLYMAVIYHAKNVVSHAQRFYGAGILLSAGAGVISVLLGLFIIPIALSTHGTSMIYFAQIALIASVFILINLVNASILRVREQFFLLNVLRLFIPILILVFLVFFWLIDNFNPYTTVMSYLVPEIVISFGTMIYLLHTLGWMACFQQVRDSSRKLLHYGMRSFGTDALNTFMMYIDQIILITLLSTSQIGLYAVAVSLARMLMVFPHSIVTVLLPKVSGKSKQDIIQFTTRAFRISFYVSLFAGVLLVLLTPLLLQLMYGDAFTTASQIVRILIFDVILSGAVIILSQVFFALEKPGKITYAHCIGLTFSIIFIYLLVPHYGTVGAALALLAATMLKLLFVFMLFPIVLKSPFPSLKLNREDVRWLYHVMLGKRAKR